jgi:protein SCO1/2
MSTSKSPFGLRSALALIAVVIVAAAAAYFWTARQNPAGESAGALIGGPFELTSNSGERVTDKTYAGRYMLVYFGYTYCPDVCPIGLSVMTEAYASLPDALREQIVPIFVTVDPERDTVEVIDDYVGLFHPDLVGLTGTPEQIAAMGKTYRVYFSRADSAEAKDYLVDHSAFTYLMDQNGLYLTHFGHGTTAEEMAGKLSELLG